MPGTAPTGWKTPKTNWASADVILPEDVNRIEGNINAIEQGSRTIDPSQAPTGVAGNLRNFLDWFANRIRAITGTTNWYDAPPATLSGLNTSLSSHKSASPIDHPDGSVTAAKIASGAVTSDKLAAGAVTAGKLADGAVDTINRIASGIRTTPGGTEPNRLARTDASGAVGLAQSALNAQALGGVPASGYARIATGVYTGNDVDGRAFNLGFQPKFVRVYYLYHPSGSGSGFAYITEASPEMTAAGIYMRHRATGTERETFSNNSKERLEVTATGFIVGSGASVNRNPIQYGYIAIG